MPNESKNCRPQNLPNPPNPLQPLEIVLNGLKDYRTTLLRWLKPKKAPRHTSR